MFAPLPSSRLAHARALLASVLGNTAPTLPVSRAVRPARGLRASFPPCDGDAAAIDAAADGADLGLARVDTAITDRARFECDENGELRGVRA